MSANIKTARHHEEKRELPDGWRWVKLGEVCEFIRGVSFDKAEVSVFPEEGKVPILRAGNIRLQLDTTYDLIWVPNENVSSEQFLRVGDSVICMSSGSADVVGKTAPVEEEWKGSVGAFCGIVRAKNPSTADFFNMWFRSRLFLDWRDDQARGANIQNLRFSQLSKLEIPLPPLAEQRRIAGVLREQMAAVEKARAAARTRLAAVKDLPAAFLRQVFPQPGQALPDGWRWVKLGEVCEIEMGQSPPGNSYNENRNGEPLLNGPSEFGEKHPIAVQWTTAPTKFARNGDILFCVRGATTGRKNVADKRYCIGRGLAALRAKNGCSSNEFIWNLLDVVTERLLESAAGSTFINLPGAELEKFAIPLPSLPEQQRIAGVLREQMTAVEKARTAAEEELNTINGLPAGLLRRAFNGEL